MSKIIDVETRPELIALVEELAELREERLLRWRGEVVAVVRPAPLVDKVAAEDADAAFRAAAGSWRGHIDVDAFVEENYRRRLVSTRSPVEL